MPYKKINSKWNQVLNGELKLLIFLEEEIWVNLHDRGLGNGFLGEVKIMSNTGKK